MTNYFSQFPVMEYDGRICTDITRRVRLDAATRKALTLYYSYDIKDGTRADSIADAYYKDPTLDWLIYLSNDIIDPYTQWNLSEDDFNQYLIKKYGSVENSIERIACYRNNWYEDRELLTPEFYNNTLPYLHKKYYQPFFGNNTNILYWERRKDDWLMETNEIWKMTVSDHDFIVGDLVVMGTATVSTTIFNGEITSIDEDDIYIKNVSYTSNPEDLTKIARASEIDITFTVSSSELVFRAIGLDENKFWSPVTYYDLENEQNTYNRSIRILDNSYVLTTTELIRKKLNES